jgi:hypothetical protein
VDRDIIVGNADHLRKVFKHLDAWLGEGDHRRLGELRAEALGGFARGQRRKPVAHFQHDGIQSCARKPKRRRRADDPAADHNHIGGFGECLLRWDENLRVGHLKTMRMPDRDSFGHFAAQRNRTPRATINLAIAAILVRAVQERVLSRREFRVLA